MKHDTPIFAGLFLVALSFVLSMGCSSSLVDAVQGDVARAIDATLSSLSIDTGTLTPAFAPTVTDYAAAEDDLVSSLAITAVKVEPGSKIEVRVGLDAWAEIASGSVTGALAVGSGDATIEVRVTANDGTTTRTYSIRVIRRTLSGLLPSAGSLVPAFASGLTNYVLDVPSATSSITLAPTVVHAETTASVRIAGGAWQAVASGAASPALGPLSLGDNRVEIKVAAADGTSNSYFININRSDLWARTTTSGAFSQGNATATDSSGNVYVVGSIDGSTSYDFGNGVTVAGGCDAVAGATSPGNAVIVKYSPSGTAIWARSVTGNSSVPSASPPNPPNTASDFLDVTVDLGGNIYVAGFLFGGVSNAYDFGNSVTWKPVSGGDNAILVKYDPTGAAQWVCRVTAASYGSSFNAVTADSAGNIYAGGWLYNNAAFTLSGSAASGSTPVTLTATKASGNNFVLAKYTSTGDILWAMTTSTATTQTSVITSLAIDSADMPVAAMTISGGGTFTIVASRSVSLPSTGANLAVVKFNTTPGYTQWQKAITNGSVATRALKVAVDASDNVLLAAIATDAGTLSLGGGVSVVTGLAAKNNFLLLKFASLDGAPIWARSLASAPDVAKAGCVDTDASGNIYVVGYLSGILPYNFGNGVMVTAPTSGTNAYLAKFDPSGSALWTRVPGSSASSIFTGISIAPSGSAIAVGQINGAATTFGAGASISGSSLTQPSIAVVKY